MNILFFTARNSRLPLTTFVPNPIPSLNIVNPDYRVLKFMEKLNNHFKQKQIDFHIENDIDKENLEFSNYDYILCFPGVETHLKITNAEKTKIINVSYPDLHSGDISTVLKKLT